MREQDGEVSTGVIDYDSPLNVETDLAEGLP